jgi:hypothetical protein
MVLVAIFAVVIAAGAVVTHVRKGVLWEWLV